MLAIVIPYYKLTFFQETLESLANQTNKQFKVYIGDDGSPENPNKLLEKYDTKIDFVYHRFDDNLGSISLVKQWGRCIALSQAEPWIMILGDDDYLENNVIESFYKNEETFTSKSNIVRFASKLIFQKTRTISEVYNHPIWEKATDSYFRKIKYLTRSSLSEYVFKRDSYIANKFTDFPLAWYSDDMAWIAFSENKLIFSINEATVNIRNSSLNISGKQDNLKAKGESKLLFHKKLIDTYFYQFNKKQKSALLFDFEVTAKYQNKLSLNKYFYIIVKLIENGLYVDFAKFIGRRFKANKNN